MTDRRTQTSRANLGDHIPEALDPTGTVVVAVRLPRATLEAIDRARGNRTRSEYLRVIIDTATR